jgi:hypothetical protein
MICIFLGCLLCRGLGGSSEVEWSWVSFLFCVMAVVGVMDMEDISEFCWIIQ